MLTKILPTKSQPQNKLSTVLLKSAAAITAILSNPVAQQMFKDMVATYIRHKRQQRLTLENEMTRHIEFMENVGVPKDLQDSISDLAPNISNESKETLAKIAMDIYHEVNDPETIEAQRSLRKTKKKNPTVRVRNNL